MTDASKQTYSAADETDWEPDGQPGSVADALDQLADTYSSGTAIVTDQIAITAYIEANQKFTEQQIHGGLLALATADTLSSGVDIVVSKGTGKLLLVVNAGSDLAGTVTITGTSVDRNTGAETASDTDTITLSGVSTDASDTDAESNARYSFTGAYISAKWFTGSVTISTTDVNLSDVDVYHVSFEQFNDQTDIEVQTFDINTLTTNANAWLYGYLYTIEVTGSLANVTRIASLSIADGDALADQFWRLRRGELAASIDGSTDGIFVDLFLGPPNQTYFEDVTCKVWAKRTSELNVVVTADALVADGDVIIPAGSSLSTDTILPTTPGADVTVDGVIIAQLPRHFMTLKNNGTVVVNSATWTPLKLTAILRQSGSTSGDPTPFGHADTGANGSIQTTTAGVYMISMVGRFLNSGSGVTQYNVRIERDTGAGFAVYESFQLGITTTINGDLNPGMSDYPIDADADDKWRIAFQRFSGTNTGIAVANALYVTMRGPFIDT